MPVKHAVLGLLMERRGYGYEVAQRLTARLGPAWKLSLSAVYAALDQLEADGLIRSMLRDVPQGADGRVGRTRGRVIYEPLPAAEQAFARWFSELDGTRAPVRSELDLKVALASAETLPLLMRAIEHEEWLARRLYAECREASEDETTRLGAVGAMARLEGELAGLAATREGLRKMLSSEHSEPSSKCEARCLRSSDRASMSKPGGT